MDLTLNDLIDCSAQTVTGTSFATLAVSSSIFNALYADGTCPSSIVDGATVKGGQLDSLSGPDSK